MLHLIFFPTLSLLPLRKQRSCVYIENLYPRSFYGLWVRLECFMLSGDLTLSLSLQGQSHLGTVLPLLVKLHDTYLPTS